MSVKQYNIVTRSCEALPRSKRLRTYGEGSRGGSAITLGGGDGHTHNNKSTLDAQSIDAEGYLYLKYKPEGSDDSLETKIKAGFADNASALDNHDSSYFAKATELAEFKELFSSMFEFDSNNNAIKAKSSLYSVGAISAMGIGSGGSSTGGGSGVTEITIEMVVSALGYTPYDAANPAGFITNDALLGYATEDYVTTKLVDYAPLTSVQGFENRIGGLEGAVPQLNERITTLQRSLNSTIEEVSELSNFAYFLPSGWYVGRNTSRDYKTYIEGKELFLRYGAEHKVAVYIRESGNVGIGVSQPSFPLDVKGTIRATFFYGTANNANQLGEHPASYYAKADDIRDLQTTTSNISDIVLSLETGVGELRTELYDNYALKSDIPALSGYATKDWVTANYAPLTSVQSFENRISNSEGSVMQLNDRVGTVESKISTLNEFVSTGENNLLDRVNNIEAEYVTRGVLETTINGINISAYFLASSFTKANIKSTLGISDWALEATKPSYEWSEITYHPTALSQFTDDVVAGRYLPLSGGEMSGSIVTPKDDNMGILPHTNNWGQIGSATKKFYRMYASTFYGNLAGNVTAESITIGNVSLSYDSTNDALCINGNMYATGSVAAKK